jgi:hypothetical protein
MAVALLSVACGGGEPQAASATEARAKLQRESAAREASLRKLAGADPAMREQCETVGADCAILVKERRDTLYEGHHFYMCATVDDPERRDRCQEDVLVQAGEVSEVAEYYAYANWCSSSVTQCIADLEQKAADAARQEKIAKRKVTLTTAPAAADLQAQLDAAEQGLAFVRQTLPPSADSLCRELPGAKECQARAEQAQAELDAYLQKPDAEYDEKTAAGLYEKARQSEASCPKVEFDCLSEKLGDFGATAQTRQELAKNLALIAKRERLRGTVDGELAEQCVADGTSRNQARIVELYAQYAQQPITYFCLQLQRAFLAVHEYQVRCMGGKP